MPPRGSSKPPPRTPSAGQQVYVPPTERGFGGVGQSSDAETGENDAVLEKSNLFNLVGTSRCDVRAAPSRRRSHITVELLPEWSVGCVRCWVQRFGGAGACRGATPSKFRPRCRWTTSATSATRKPNWPG